MPKDGKKQALEVALGQIEKQFGAGSIMRLGASKIMPVAVIGSKVKAGVFFD